MAGLLKTRAAGVVFLVVICGFYLLAQANAGQRRQPQAVRPPVISPPGGTFSHRQNVTIVIRAEPDCRIIYSFVDAFPNYGKGIVASRNKATVTLPPGNSVLRAVAVRPGMPVSQPTEAKYFRAGE